MTFLGKIGKHSDVKREIPKKSDPPPKVEPEIKSEPEVEPEIDENDFREILITESPLLAKQEIKSDSLHVFCRKCRKSEVSGECVYHSGQVIFHETLKYWTCCPHKKFTDFDDFEALIGCCRGDHEMTTNSMKPREDWFQTQNKVHVILYGLKGSRAQHSSVTTNGKTLIARFNDSKGIILFQNEWKLSALISSSESRVVISSSKVEIILEKFLKKSWNKLNEN